MFVATLLKNGKIRGQEVFPETSSYDSEISKRIP
jgi:hypothetical protein